MKILAAVRRFFAAWDRWAYGVTPCGKTYAHFGACPVHHIYCPYPEYEEVR